MLSTFLLLSTSTLYALLVSAGRIEDDYAQITIGDWVISRVYPTATLGAAACTATNVVPTDLAQYTQSIYRSDDGVIYNVTNTAGWVQDWQSPRSLQGVVFGPNGANANSFGQCVPQCADWCNSHSDCWSFNVFTFQEEDYADCQVTCQCRAVNMPFNKTSIQDGTYRPMDPVWPSYVYSRDAYCFKPGCCLDNTASDFDECLWEAADIPGYIQHFYDTHSNTSSGIIYDISVAELGEHYNCQVTDIEGCTQALNSPNTSDPESIRAFLAVVALRRWMLFMAAKRNFIKDTFLENVIPDIQDIVSKLTGAQTKPAIQQNKWGEDILAMMGTVISWALVPEGVALTKFASMMGKGAKVADLVFSLGQDNNIPSPAAVTGLPGYVSNISVALQAMIEQRAADFETNMIVTNENVELMDGSILKLTPEANWLKPDLFLQQTQPITRSWTISAIFKALGLFIHSENTPKKETTYSYSGERFFTRQVGATQIPTYAFPVYYLPRSSPHDNRVYGAAGALSAYHIDWTDIYRSSSTCQYNVNEFSKFGANTYPQIDPDLVYSTLLNNPNTNPNSIPCMWNLPICDASVKDLVSQCTDNQRCCTGHTTNGKGDSDSWHIWGIPDGGIFDYYDRDNFALDDWCAVKLGHNGLLGSQPWKSANLGANPRPFMDC